MSINISGSIEDIKKYIYSQNNMTNKIDTLNKIKDIISNHTNRLKDVNNIDYKRNYDFEAIGKEVVYLLDAPDKKRFEDIILNPFREENQNMFKLITYIFLLLIIIPQYSYASHHVFRNMIGLNINDCEIIDVRYVQETHGSNEKYAFVCIGHDSDGNIALKEYRFYHLIYENDLSAKNIKDLLEGRDVQLIKKDWFGNDYGGECEN